MLGIIVIVLLAGWAVLQRQTVKEVSNDLPDSLAYKLGQLLDLAQESLQNKKYLRAEKALLTILRVDERNATAYNRLGILYAKQQSYKEAIECFEIAQSLEPSASSLHNVGLIYYETGQYDQAALAFEQALAMDGDLALRHIAYARVQEKLGHTKKMLESLRRAVELDPTPHTLSALADAYDRVGQPDRAAAVRGQLATPTPTRAQHPA